MERLSKIYMVFGSVLPSFILDHIEEKIKKSGMETTARVWVGSVILVSLLFMAIITSIYIILTQQYEGHEKFIVPVVILSFLFHMLLEYVFLHFRVVSRTKNMEKVLPDFLLLVASNLRAGMVPFSAFVAASREEFGELYYEIKKTSKLVGGKSTLDNALKDLSTRFDSMVLKRSVSLFSKGARSGGHLAKLLTTNAEEIRKIQDLREELITMTKTYMIFIGFVVVFIMPFLLSISVYFLATFLTIQEQTSNAGGGTASNLPLFTGKITITVQEMTNISVATIVITSLLAASLISIIRVGNLIYTLRYFPLVAGGGIIFFFITSQVIAKMLSFS